MRRAAIALVGASAMATAVVAVAPTGAAARGSAGAADSPAHRGISAASRRPGGRTLTPLGNAEIAAAAGPARAPQRTSGATGANPNGLTQPPRLDVAPPGHRLTAEQALALAARLGAVRGAQAGSPGSYGVAYLKGATEWQVSYFSRSGKEIAQVLIDDASGKVLEAWTGFRVAWTMARGYPGAFGRRVNALYIWIPLSIAFVLPFVNPRRPWRLLHLDLLVLSAFSISLAFFNHGDVEASVPLSYPPLVYLLLRMGLAAVGRPRRSEPLTLLVPARWLTVAVVFLIGFRVGLNVADSNVIDVGYAGVIGAHRLADGQTLYGAFPQDNAHGDTYGPVVYEAYVPFERALGWSGRWDDLPAAHAAAIFFDLLALGLVFMVGRRIRGPTLGIALAYAWLAYPFTLFALDTNTNDVLVPALVLAALLAARRPAARGALAALAGLTKFAPLVLAPALALYRTPGQSTRRSVAGFTVAFVLAAGVALAPVLIHSSVHAFWERTVVNQFDRSSPFSIWGLYGGLGAVQAVVQAAAVIVALVLAVAARRRDVVALAAACAAALIALQVSITHWFYLYIVWFFPLTMLVLLGDGKHDLLDRIGPQRARAADDDAHEPRILVGALEADRHLGDQ